MKKHSNPAHKSHSFTVVFLYFIKENSVLHQIVEFPVTGKPCAIVNEDIKSRSNQKSHSISYCHLMLQLYNTKIY